MTLPSFTAAPGNYSSAQSITIATIRYTTDGSAPTATAGTVYTAPVNVSANLTLKAIAYESGMTDSPYGQNTQTR